MNSSSAMALIFNDCTAMVARYHLFAGLNRNQDDNLASCIYSRSYAIVSYRQHFVGMVHHQKSFQKDTDAAAHDRQGKNDLESYSEAFDTLDSGGFGPTQLIKFLGKTRTSHVVMGAALPATNV